MPGKDKGRDIQNLVVDGNELHQEAIAESLNQYFTSIALSLLDGRTIDRKNEGNHQPSRDQCATFT